MPFYGDDGALEKFRTFARPSCFSPAPPTKACPSETQQGVHVTGKPPPRPASSTSGQQRFPNVGGHPLPPRPHCSHPGHKAEHCLKQHFCPSCVRWGHKPGDCELAKDIFALLRAYGYPTCDTQGRPYGRSRQRGGALAGTNNSKDEESGDDTSDSNPAAAAAGHMTSANVSSSSPPPFSFDGLGSLLDVGASDLLLSLLRYARRTATSRVIQISHSDVPSTSSVIHPISWSDAALGTAGNAHPQTGWLLSLGSAILHWRSFSQQRVAHSSTRAELYAAHDLVNFLECLLPALRCVWKAGMVSEVRVDSDDLLKLVSSEMPRSTERALLSVIQSL
uniref:Uncharacterized protein n=1 Tax=Chromera velia CCMP2878 TaxID=1169474 RepID=A0A0G4FZJ4_9ALVE|eukprot:Cvel_19554.t1-p1 / transcript=Cvel_19554.t1 / gene=Cvel_19554 / organism=Chromera_velia_CCMP2878 / gene_product=hypothetical protein / transcript_product=hypothetical protein / location=Cvel_scaffold1695:4576-8974(-) / protein_length=334 / sequence_SO=supercontig / SO=protein_coding / is_pseudo=false